MKTIYRLNIVAIIITLILYSTIWLGILSQIALGLLQIVCLIILLLGYENYSKQNKRLLTVYGFVTTIIIASCFFDTDLVVKLLWPTSGLLALFFLLITYKLQKVTL